MYRSPRYPTEPAALERFVSGARHGTLIATPPGGHPQVSLLPFVKDGDRIELHIVRQDPTYAAALANPQVTFLVSDFLAFTPHDFVDPDDVGKATLHFRAAAFECVVDWTSEDPLEVQATLQRLVDHHEADRPHPPVPADSRMAMLAALRLRVVAVAAKFKVGPAGSDDVKRQVADRLRERGEPGDARAALVIDDSIGRP